MAELEVHPQKLTQLNLQLEEEIHHVRRLMQLLEECREYDTMHPKQLRDIHQRLEYINADLVHLQHVNEMILIRCAKMEENLNDGLKRQQRKILRILNN